VLPVGTLAPDCHVMRIDAALGAHLAGRDVMFAMRR